MNLRRTFAIYFFSHSRCARSMTAVCSILFELAAAGLASSASAATLTVGRGQGVSYFTLSGALAASNPGDVILVQGGVYSASSGETFPLGLKYNVQLRAANPANPPTIRGNGAAWVFLIGGSEGWLIEGFRITGGGGSPGGGVYCGNTSGTFRNCRIEENLVDAGEGLGVYSENSTLNFFNCTIQNNRNRVPSERTNIGYGFVAKGSGATFFRNSTIAFNAGGGVICSDTHLLRVFNSLIARNDPDEYAGGAHGLFFNSTGDCRVVNSSIVGHKVTGVWKSFASVLTIENSIVWNFGQSISRDGAIVKNSCIRGGYPGENVGGEYPRFVDPAGDDWRLADGSPYIDQGDSLLAPEGVTIDLDGSPRIQGAAVDLGPYESPGTYIPTPGDPPPARIHVAKGGKGGAGNTWEEAIPTLFEALLRTGPGCEVWVTGETYPESIAAAHTLSLYGGFQGDESSPDERDPNASRTILDATGTGSPVILLIQVSGFLLDGFSLRNGTSAEGGGGISARSSSGTIRNCEILNNSTVHRGGGASIMGNANFHFEDTLFQGNQAPGIYNASGPNAGLSNGIGGAINLFPFEGGTMVLRNCRFIENSSALRGMAIGGSSFFEARIQIEDCTFEGNFNSRTRPGSVRDFAILHIPGGIVLDIQNTRFLRNRKVPDPDFPHLNSFQSFVIYQEPASGGAVELENCELAENINMSGVSLFRGGLSNTVIRDHPGVGASLVDTQISKSRISNNGMGGVEIRGSAEPITIRDCLFELNGWGDSGDSLISPTGGLVLRGGLINLLDSRIERNRGISSAGGVTSNAAQLTMRNTLIVGNESTAERDATGGASIQGTGPFEMVNCTVTGNREIVTGSTVFTGMDGIRVGSSVQAALANSIIWNGTRALSLPAGALVTHCNLSQFCAGEGNIYSDPQFLHPWDGEFADLRLPCDSPAVDAGTLEGAPTRDIEGVTRPRGSGVDMGAYENCHFDVNGDRIEDRRDLLSFSPHWYNPTDETNFGFDLDRLPPSTGRIDRLDLDQLLEAVK